MSNRRGGEREVLIFGVRRTDGRRMYIYRRDDASDMLYLREPKN